MTNAHRYEGKRCQLPADQTPASQASSKRKPIVLIVALIIIAGLIGTGLFIKYRVDVAAPNLTVEKAPSLTGVNLTIPFTDEQGQPLCKPVYDGSTQANRDAGQPRKKVGCDLITKLQLDVPLNGQCPIAEDGSIGAPSDYTTACSYEDERGGIAFLGHSVRGPRMGALERIHLLSPGDVVKVGDQTYKVANVGRYPASNLPNRFWQKGHLSLVSCFIDGKADAGGSITTDTVVELTDA